MKRTAHIALFVCFAFIASLVPAPVHAWGDSEAKLVKDIQARGIVTRVESRYSRGIQNMPIDELRARIEEVRGSELPVHFGRNVMVNPASGLLGVLTGALGVKTALSETVAPEEAGMDQAFVIKPATSDYTNWTSYLTGRNKPGARAIAMALRLRRQARIAKFEAWLEEQCGKSFAELTEGDLASVKSSETYCWLANDVFEPVTFVLDPELLKVLGKNMQETGPAFGPLPSLNLIQPEELAGVANVQTRNGFVIDPDTGRYLVKRTDSVVLMQDLGDVMSIDQAIDTDTLGDVVGHELFHGIMSDLMGTDAPGGPKSLSQLGHDAPIVSDESMAISEGWAEFFEAWTGIDNPTFDNSKHDSPASEFLIGRQVPIRLNRYAQEGFEKFKSTTPSGRVKNGSAMMACEGLVASLIHFVATHDELPDALPLCFEVMVKDRPQRSTEFFSALARRARSEKARKSILLGFCYMTKFCTVSAEARDLYQQSYTAELAFKRGANAKVAGLEELRTEATRTRRAYEALAETLAQQVMAGSLELDANVGPEIWLDFVVERKGKKIDLRLNLNSADDFWFGIADLSADQIAELMAARDRAGCFRDFREVKRSCPSCFDALNAAHENFSKNAAAAAQAQ